MPCGNAVFVENFLKNKKVYHKNLDNSPFHSELPTFPQCLLLFFKKEEFLNRKKN